MLVKSYKKLSHIKMIVFLGFQPFCLKSSPNVFYCFTAVFKINILPDVFYLFFYKTVCVVR